MLGGKTVLFLQSVQEIEDFLRLLGVVTFVSLPQNVPGRRGNRVLAGRAAHVEAADFSRACRNHRRCCWRHQRRVLLERLDLDETVTCHR